MNALQLNPPLVVSTPLGDGWAHVMIDYGPQTNPVFTVELESGDFKSFTTEQLKSCGNKTFEFKRGTQPPSEHHQVNHDLCNGCGGTGKSFWGGIVEPCISCLGSGNNLVKEKTP